MKRIAAFLILLAISSTAPGQLVPKKVIVDPLFQPFIDTNKMVMIPGEYEINVFYAGALKRPRFMALGPKNTIYVADMNANHILALPDANHDGIADSAVIAAPDVDTAHSLAFYNGAMYVAQPSRVRKFSDLNGDGFFETEEPFISGIGDTGYYNHFTRTIIFDTIGNHIYLSVGASCNDCREGDSERATILQFNPDGSGRKIYATGLRNALGLAINPLNGDLWAANADRDGLGDNIPSEVISSVHQGDFFGWPFAYGAREWEDFSATPEYQGVLPITANDSVKVLGNGISINSGMRFGDVFIHAHSTPMQLLFYRDPQNNMKPDGSILVAIHGSSPSGKMIGLGYKVIKIVYSDSLEGWKYSDFLTGFLTDSVNYAYWGRPCGLVQDTTGDIYLSTDQGIPAIYRIHLRNQSAVKDPQVSQTIVTCFPNPIANSAMIKYALSHSEHVKLELIDQLGRILRIIHEGNEGPADKNISLSLNGLPDGVYYLRMQTDEGIITKKIVKIK